MKIPTSPIDSLYEGDRGEVLIAFEDMLSAHFAALGGRATVSQLCDAFRPAPEERMKCMGRISSVLMISPKFTEVDRVTWAPVANYSPEQLAEFERLQWEWSLE